jgi:hypothetical protein
MPFAACGNGIALLGSTGEASTTGELATIAPGDAAAAAGLAVVVADVLVCALSRHPASNKAPLAKVTKQIVCQKRIILSYS